MLTLACLVMILAPAQDRPSPRQPGAADLAPRPAEDRLLVTVPEDYGTHREYELPSGQISRQTLPVAWSPDGSKVAWFGWRKGELHAFLNGDEVGESGDLANAPAFSANGEHVLWTIGRKKRGGGQDWRVIVDDKTIDKADWVGKATIADDGDAVAYWTKPGYEVRRDGLVKHKDAVLVHAKRSGRRFKKKESDDYGDFLMTSAPSLARDGSRAIGVAHENSGYMVISVGGKKDEIVDKVGTLFPDVVVHSGKSRVAAAFRDYQAERPPWAPQGFAATVLSLDGRTVDLDGIEAGLPTFSGDGKRLGFACVDEDGFDVGVDDRSLEVGSGDPITLAVLDQEGDRIAWIEHPGGEITPSSWLMSHARKMAGDVPSRVRWVEVGKRGAKGEPVDVGDFDYVREILFEPGGPGIALVVQEDRQWYVVVGEERAGPFESIGPVRWAAAGRVEFGTREGREFWWRGVGGE